jgi:hypothetical protein
MRKTAMYAEHDAQKPMDDELSEQDLRTISGGTDTETVTPGMELPSNPPIEPTPAVPPWVPDDKYKQP